MQLREATWLTSTVGPSAAQVVLLNGQMRDGEGLRILQALAAPEYTARVIALSLEARRTKGGTTGTLFSAADFQSPGDRSVVSGDTLTVTYTFSLTAT